MEDPVSLSDAEPCEISHYDPSSVVSNFVEPTRNSEILVMTVEIGDGRQDVISVKENDDPKYLAKEFAFKHGLGQELQNSLAQLIVENKERVEKRAHNSSGDLNNWKELLGNMPNSASTKDLPRKVREDSPEESYTPHINAKSRSITQGKRNGNVHDRLYQQARKSNRPKTASTTSIIQKSKSGEGANYGEWLYIRGMKMKESRCRDSLAKKKEIEQKSAKELTFKPAINKYSALLSPRFLEKTEELLLKKELDRREKIEELKIKFNAEKMKECSFNPKINKNSEKMNMSRSSSKPRFEELYDKAHKLSEKRLSLSESVSKDFSFRPNIGIKKKDPESPDAFISRLVNSKKKFEEEMERKRHKSLELVDENGQPLFRPSIHSRSPSFRDFSTPIWDYLYSGRDQKQKIITKAKSIQEEQLKSISDFPKYSSKSLKIYEEFLIKQYEKLFNMLDSDMDGYINSISISIDSLDAKSLDILTPLFKELQETGAQLNYESFCKKLNIIVSGLTIEEKAHLLKRDSKELIETPTHKVSLTQPTLSKVTQVMMADKRKSESGSDIYDRLVKAYKITEEKNKQTKEILENKKLEVCTFKPKIHRLKRKA